MNVLTDFCPYLSFLGLSFTGEKNRKKGLIQESKRQSEKLVRRNKGKEDQI